MKIASLKEAQVFDEERFTRQVVFRTENTTAILLNFLPGQELPPHRHPGQDVLIQVLRGYGTGKLGEAPFTFSEQDAIHCSGEEELYLRNSGDKPLSLFVILNKIDPSSTS